MSEMFDDLKKLNLMLWNGEVTKSEYELTLRRLGITRK